MRVSTLASGSKGNCIYIDNGNDAILIDQGLSLKELKSRANIAGVDLAKVKAVLVTHEHIDHIRGIGVLSRAIGAEIYAPDKCYNQFSSRLGDMNYAGSNPSYDNGFNVGEFSIKPFRTPHDSVYSVGYRVECDGKVCSLATDLGTINTTIFDHIKGSDMVIIESNHDIQMLKNGSYPPELKRRILGNTGHLSNELSARVVQELAMRGTTKFFLAHLSEDNNMPELAFNESHKALCDIGANDIELNIANQYKPSKIHIV